LGNYLKEKNIDVPFIIPEASQEEVLPQRRQRTTHPVRETREKPAASAATTSYDRATNQDPQMLELKNSLRRNDIDKALEIKER
jgi:hypothetical protein